MAKQSRYRITARWDDGAAEYEYILEKDCGSSFKEPEDIAAGDKAWATRQAAHYNITVPQTPEEKLETASKPLFSAPANPISFTPTMPFTTTTGNPNLPSSTTGQIYTPQPDMGKFTPSTTIAEAR